MKVSPRLAIITASLLLSAMPSQANSPVKSGFYAGASVGLSSLSAKQDFQRTNDAFPAASDKRKYTPSSQSASLAIFGGYGHRIKCTWLGAELSYLLDRLDGRELSNFEGNRGFQVFKVGSRGGSLGLSFHFGYIPQDNLVLYGILGLESRRIQVKAQDEFTPPSFFSNINKRYNSLAFVPGIGARISFTKNVSMKAEYKYAFHRSKTLTLSATNQNIGIGGIDTSVLKTSPRIQSFHIGFVYSF